MSKNKWRSLRIIPDSKRTKEKERRILPEPYGSHWTVVWETKRENNLFSLERDRSDYKENNNPNSLGWAGDIYSRPAVTSIPLLCNTAGIEGGESRGGKPMTEKRHRKKCVCACVEALNRWGHQTSFYILSNKEIERTYCHYIHKKWYLLRMFLHFKRVFESSGLRCFWSRHFLCLKWNYAIEYFFK